MEWLPEIGANYIAYSEGNYYKVNNAIVFRIDKKELVLRNTWTGKEKVLKKGIKKQEAIKFMDKFIKTNFKRI